jgi:hypothetical protein
VKSLSSEVMMKTPLGFRLKCQTRLFFAIQIDSGKKSLKFFYKVSCLCVNCITLLNVFGFIPPIWKDWTRTGKGLTDTLVKKSPKMSPNPYMKRKTFPVETGYPQGCQIILVQHTKTGEKYTK